MFVLPLISILSVLNKLIGSICDGGKQARTQERMFWTRKDQFEANTHVRRHYNLAHCFKYKMLLNCTRLSSRKWGWAPIAEWWKVRLSGHKDEWWKSGAKHHSIHKTCHWEVEECRQAVARGAWRWMSVVRRWLSMVAYFTFD